MKRKFIATSKSPKPEIRKKNCKTAEAKRERISIMGFEKWHAICASAGGVLTWVAC